MAETEKTTNSRRSLMKYVLIVSLGLNLVVVGMVGGHFLRDRPEGRMRAEREVGALGLRIYYRAFDDQQKAALNDAIKAQRGQIKAGRQTLRMHRRALAATLEAEPFDPAAVRAVLTAQAEVVGENVGRGHILLLARLEAMSPEARKSLAKRLKAPRGSRKAR